LHVSFLLENFAEEFNQVSKDVRIWMRSVFGSCFPFTRQKYQKQSFQPSSPDTHPQMESRTCIWFIWFDFVVW